MHRGVVQMQKMDGAELKQINVPVEDEVYEAAKLLAAKCGMLLKAWVARAILNQAAKERNDGNS
jgi:predicted HicB family RNase H-like nuclease